MSIVVEESKDIYVVYINTDLAEGRGWTYPHFHCELLSTAERYASKKGVMGCDAGIRECKTFTYNNILYGPINIITPTKDDIINSKKRELLNKIKELGITDEEIKLLTK